MLRKLRRKFIIIIMLLVSILLSVILCSICFYLYHNLKSEMNASLKNAVEYVQAEEENTSAGNIPAGKPDGSPAGTNSNTLAKPSDIKRQESGMSYTSICVIRYDTKTEEVTVKLDNLEISKDTLNAAAKTVQQNRQREGSIDAYNLFYYSAEYENGMLIALAENNYVTSTLAEYGVMLLLVEACALIVIFLISLLVSELAIKPIAKAMEEQKRFIADASHELKTPLTVIMANNSILRTHKEKSIAEQIMWLDSTDEEVKHMSGLINDMLILAKSESGLQEKKFVPVNVSAIVMRCTLQFEAVAYERSIAVEERIHEGIYVSGNEVQLRQLVMSLIDNAVKYEAEGGIITVTLDRNRDKAEIKVTNSKTVISKEALPHIFERFYRMESADKGNNSFGLGLSIAKSIAESHGGSISVKSSAAEGTTFRVLLRTISTEK